MFDGDDEFRHQTSVSSGRDVVRREPQQVHVEVEHVRPSTPKSKVRTATTGTCACVALHEIRRKL